MTDVHLMMVQLKVGRKAQNLNLDDSMASNLVLHLKWDYLRVEVTELSMMMVN